MKKKPAVSSPPPLEEPFRRLDFWSIVLGHRLLLLLGAALVQGLGGNRNHNAWNLWFDNHSGAAMIWRPFSHWDGQHYLLLAEKGYGAVQLHHQAFYPLFPWGIQAFALLTQSLPAAALLLTLLATLLFARFFWLWARAWLSPSQARLALLSVLVLPQAFYVGVIYTESLFLAALFGFLYLHRKNSAWQVLPAFLMPLVRAQGLFVLAALLAAWLFLGLRRRAWPRRVEGLGALALGVGAGAYFAFMAFSTGDAMSGFKAQATFISQNSAWNVLNPLAALGNLTRPAPDWFDVEQGAFDKIFMWVMLAGLWPVWKMKEPLVFWLYLALCWVPLAMGTGQSYFRYSLVAAPLLGVAVWRGIQKPPEKIRRPLFFWLIVFFSLQAWAFWRFAQNLWVA